MGLFLRCFDEMTVIMIVIVPLYPLGGGLLRCESPQMKKGNVVTLWGGAQSCRRRNSHLPLFGMSPEPEREGETLQEARKWCKL